MTDDARDKLIAVVGKLLELTQKRQIQWVRLTSQEGWGIFETMHLGQRLRISADPRNAQLDFLSESGEVNYVIRNAGVRDLFESVRRQTSNIDEFLQKLGVG